MRFSAIQVPRSDSLLPVRSELRLLIAYAVLRPPAEVGEGVVEAPEAIRHVGDGVVDAEADLLGAQASVDQACQVGVAAPDRLQAAQPLLRRQLRQPGGAGAVAHRLGARVVVAAHGADA